MMRIATLGKLHRIFAFIIGAYVAVHLFNHGLALEGVDAHIQFMKSFRRIYRNPFVEVFLLVSIAFRIGSGSVRFQGE